MMKGPNPLFTTFFVTCGLSTLMAFGAISQPAQADALPLTAPEIVADNPVLTVMQSRWSFDGTQVVVAGAYMSFDERAYMEAGLHPGTDAFWSAIKDLDTAGIIAEAKPVDNVGLSYFVPFILYFPTERLQTIWREDAPSEISVLQEFGSTERVFLWMQNSEVGSGATLQTALLFFSLDESVSEQPGPCHAQQVIRAIYTGAVDNAELMACRAMQ